MGVFSTMSTADGIDVRAFLAGLREKHRAYWEIPPPLLPGITEPCGRCYGTGRAPSPVGHVRCARCKGWGTEPRIKKRRRTKRRTRV
jgi:hypothetical protein